MTHAPVCDVAEAVLGEDCHLHGTSCWTTRPGRPTQGLHRLRSDRLGGTRRGLTGQRDRQDAFYGAHRPLLSRRLYEELGV